MIVTRRSTKKNPKTGKKQPCLDVWQDGGVYERGIEANALLLRDSLQAIGMRIPRARIKKVTLAAMHRGLKRQRKAGS